MHQRESGRFLVLTIAPVTNKYKSDGASFCKITSSLGGKYSAFISETFKNIHHSTIEVRKSEAINYL